MLTVILAATAVAIASAVTLLGVRSARRTRLLRAAEQRLEWGDRAGAARIFERAGDARRAATLSSEAREHLRAVELLVGLEDFDAAVEALRSARREEVERGVSLLDARGALAERTRLATLASIARAAEAPGLAAGLFDRAGNPEDARACRLLEARALASSGKPLEAAALYRRLGDRRAEAASLAEAARREAEPSRKADLGRQASALCSECGDLQGAAEALAIAGDLEKGVRLLLDARNVQGAAQLLQWHGQHARAAELFERSGDTRLAARAFGLAGDVGRAAAVLERSGDVPGAVRLLIEARDHKAAAEVHLRAGNRSAAADLYAGLGNLDRAVELHLEAGDVDSAVELLCKAGRPRDAAKHLEERGDGARAALLLSQSGDLAARATVLSAQGDFEGAAQALLDLGRPEDARTTLARAAPLSPLGRFLFARACLAAGDHAAASAHFAALLDAPPRGVQRVDLLYGLARALEATGRTAEALASLEEVLSLDASYRDASFRVRFLRARAAPPPASTSAQVAVGGGATASPAHDWSSTGPLGGADTSLPAEWGAASSQAPWGAGATAPPTARRDTRTEGVPSRYAVEREIGRGAMGIVYRARDTQLDRAVAIKVLVRQGDADPRIRDYFLREARAVAQLVHPNIVTLFDAGLEGSCPYLVMELVEGDDLRARLDRGRVPVAEALRVAAGVALGLDYAHGRSIIHRDVKPENVLVTADGSAKLMDFGVAHTVRENSSRQATIIGTPVYMAPEQIKGEHIGGWTDIYALGAVLFECLVGRPPFEPAAALFHHVNTPPPDPRALCPEIPEPLSALVLRCLDKVPARRPATARSLADELSELLRGTALRACDAAATSRGSPAAGDRS